MRRRRALAVTAAAIGLGGSGWYGRSVSKREGEAPTATATETAGGTATRNRTLGAATPSIGGSLNGRPHRLGDDFGLVERSDTEWMHAFLDVRRKYESDASPRNDTDVETLGRVGREAGAGLVVSLQWDFKGLFGEKEPQYVPDSGSDREAALFEYATDLLAAIDHPVDVVLLGNEPIWEALNEDVLGRDPSLIRFTRRLKDHLVGNYTAGDPALLVGSFNRLYDDSVRKKFGGFYGRLFEMARSDDDIDGIDLHVHYDGLQQARNMLTVAREAVPDATITATEFSPIWRYERNKDEPLAAFAGGEGFADRYGHPGDMTVLEYFRAAQEDPRPREEMADFMETMAWYNVEFVEDMYELLDRYDVAVGTFGFLQDVGFRHMELSADWRPFQINYLFQRGLIATDGGAHPHYLDGYRDQD